MRNVSARPAVRAAVLGAGVSGLYAARVLAAAGVRVTVLEKKDVVGGLAAGYERNGNFYDLGVHHLHAFDVELFDDISSLMGERLVPVEKSAKIRYGDGYRRYPLEFSDLLTGIPMRTLVHSVAGLGGQLVANRLNHFEPENAEEALIQLYGRPLYEYFFRDFTHRYWGIPPDGLSASFVRRKMPRLSAVDIFKKALGRFGLREPQGAAVESALVEETMYYSPSGSRELPMALADYVRGHDGEVLTGSTVVAVEADGSRAKAVRYEHGGIEHRLTCDAVLSTMPLPLLAQSMDPPPNEAVLAASRRLKFKAVAVYGLLVSRPKVLDALYVYYRNRVFHRIAEPRNSGMRVVPEDHSVLLVEATCNVGDDRWEGSAESYDQIVTDLEAEGLLDREEIVEWHLLRSEHAYPVFELGFEPYHEIVMEHLSQFGNLWTTGRQGAFSYPNMHQAMRIAADAAADLLSEVGIVEPGAGGYSGQEVESSQSRSRPPRAHGG